ncbi:MAG: hypothetical protein NFW16_06670, partial [Candidatus Accumulibacter sp.]|uniref:hypothetical protein n=1 Tax=Accumulibacter sp. TaxID=2053492 RepID=UPI0025889F56
SAEMRLREVKRLRFMVGKSAGRSIRHCTKAQRLMLARVHAVLTGSAHTRMGIVPGRPPLVSRHLCEVPFDAKYHKS